MSDTDTTGPTNEDPKNLQDPAHPVSGDQDAEPTMNAPDGERPDGISTDDSSTDDSSTDDSSTGSSTGGDGSPS